LTIPDDWPMTILTSDHSDDLLVGRYRWPIVSDIIIHYSLLWLLMRYGDWWLTLTDLDTYSDYWQYWREQARLMTDVLFGIHWYSMSDIIDDRYWWLYIVICVDDDWYLFWYSVFSDILMPVLFIDYIWWLLIQYLFSIRWRYSLIIDTISHIGEYCHYSIWWPIIIDIWWYRGHSVLYLMTIGIIDYCRDYWYCYSLIPFSGHWLSIDLHYCYSLTDDIWWLTIVLSEVTIRWLIYCYCCWLVLFDVFNYYSLLFGPTFDTFGIYHWLTIPFDLDDSSLFWSLISLFYSMTIQYSLLIGIVILIQYSAIQYSLLLLAIDIIDHYWWRIYCIQIYWPIHIPYLWYLFIIVILIIWYLLFICERTFNDCGEALLLSIYWYQYSVSNIQWNKWLISVTIVVIDDDWRKVIFYSLFSNHCCDYSIHCIEVLLSLNLFYSFIRYYSIRYSVSHCLFYSCWWWPYSSRCSFDTFIWHFILVTFPVLHSSFNHSLTRCGIRLHSIDAFIRVHLFVDSFITTVYSTVFSFVTIVHSFCCWLDSFVVTIHIHLIPTLRCCYLSSSHSRNLYTFCPLTRCSHSRYIPLSFITLHYTLHCCIDWHWLIDQYIRFHYSHWWYYSLTLTFIDILFGVTDLIVIDDYIYLMTDDLFWLSAWRNDWHWYSLMMLPMTILILTIVTHSVTVIVDYWLFGNRWLTIIDVVIIHFDTIVIHWLRYLFIDADDGIYWYQWPAVFGPIVIYSYSVLTILIFYSVDHCRWWYIYYLLFIDIVIQCVAWLFWLKPNDNQPERSILKRAISNVGNDLLFNDPMTREMTVLWLFNDIESNQLLTDHWHYIHSFIDDACWPHFDTCYKFIHLFVDDLLIHWHCSISIIHLFTFFFYTSAFLISWKHLFDTIFCICITCSVLTLDRLDREIFTTSFIHCYSVPIWYCYSLRYGIPHSCYISDVLHDPVHSFLIHSSIHIWWPFWLLTLFTFDHCYLFHSLSDPGDDTHSFTNYITIIPDTPSIQYSHSLISIHLPHLHFWYHCYSVLFIRKFSLYISHSIHSLWRRPLMLSIHCCCYSFILSFDPHSFGILTRYIVGVAIHCRDIILTIQ